MKQIVRAILFVLVLGTFLPGCPEKPEPAPGTITPDDFVGVWVLIPSDPKTAAKTRTMLLHKSNAERPASPGSTFMDGDVDQRMLIKGDVTDDTFVGTGAVPKMTSWASTVMMTIHQPGTATVIIDETPYRGLKRTK